MICILQLFFISVNMCFSFMFAFGNVCFKEFELKENQKLTKKIELQLIRCCYQQHSSLSCLLVISYYWHVQSIILKGNLKQWVANTVSFLSWKTVGIQHFSSHLQNKNIMAHLLDWMKVRVIEIFQEPQDTRSEYLSEKQDKWRKVEHVDHTNKPVKKHSCAWQNKIKSSSQIKVLFK